MPAAWRQTGAGWKNRGWIPQEFLLEYSTESWGDLIDDIRYLYSLLLAKFFCLMWCLCVRHLWTRGLFQGWSDLPGTVNHCLCWPPDELSSCPAIVRFQLEGWGDLFHLLLGQKTVSKGVMAQDREISELSFTIRAWLAAGCIQGDLRPWL